MALPTGNQLMDAVRLWSVWCTTDHLLLVWARDLTLLHTMRLTSGDTANLCHLLQQRADMIREIDAWVHTAVSMNPDARLHTESLGSIVDRLALRSAVIDTAGEIDPSEFGYLWNGVDELVLGYDHLSEEVLTGARRLPGPPVQPDLATPGA